jgi:hypothetical protein
LDETRNQIPRATAACGPAQVAKRVLYVTAAGVQLSLDAVRDRHPDYFEDETAPHSFQRRALRLQQ